VSEVKLTTKQRLFVEAYLADPNATAAARKAGYSGSDNTLSQRGLELVRNSKIAALLEKRIEQAAMTADEWLSGVATLARTAEKDSDKLTAFGLLGKPLNLTNNSTMNLVAKLKVKEVIRPAIKK